MEEIVSFLGTIAFLMNFFLHFVETQTSYQ